MVRKNLISLCIVALFASSAHAEKLILKLKPGFKTQNFKFMGLSKLEAVIPELGIYTVELPPLTGKPLILLNALRKAAGVKYAQEDHKITWRSTPNDPQFFQQWDLNFSATNFGIDAVGAWQAFPSTGKDIAGNDIVVAIIDGGADLGHPDLAANIWVNAAEIPGNNIDDDLNGYVDDVNGWNGSDDTGHLPYDAHGTHLAGTIGAVGNNQILGRGINSDVKMMMVTGGTTADTSIVLRAYGYVLKQKRLWIASGGKSGANVVATNSSFGVDYGDCQSGSYPAWNDIYNEMGRAGILHAIATANMAIDVDKEGDVPTGCNSEYIIAVTNTDNAGVISKPGFHPFFGVVGGAAWGLKSIDLAAPGEKIYSTLPRVAGTAQWGEMSGTSMSTPHVAGAVAYMHAVADREFNDLYAKDPSAGALALKNIMLNNVTKMPAFATKSVSGGILNLNKSAEAISLFVAPVITPRVPVTP